MGFESINQNKYSISLIICKYLQDVYSTRVQLKVVVME